MLSWEHVSLLTSFVRGRDSDAADEEEQGKNTSDAAAAGSCGYQKRRLLEGQLATAQTHPVLKTDESTY